MKIVRATAFTLLAAFIGTCAYLAYFNFEQSYLGPDIARNGAYRIRGWCPPFCGDQEQDRKAASYIEKVNSEQPGKKVAQVDKSVFQRVMYTNNGQLVKVR